MDFLPHFHREIVAFEAAVRRAIGADAAPLVPSCPGWSVSDLVAHLGGVHRYVIQIVSERLTEPPDPTERAFLGLPASIEGWPMPDNAPNRAPVPANMIDWFADGAGELESLFRSRGPHETVWTWSTEQTTGFWLRMQTIEAAVHRWDAERAVGTAQPVDAELAADAVVQTFQVMAPFRRVAGQAPAGSGERFRFRRTDGDGTWTVLFDGADVRLTDGTSADVELAGPASDLMLYLWRRIPAERLDVTGDRDVLDRYFTLVPPL
jgi:uncharacterized protein (TIGR03083 family)